MFKDELSDFFEIVDVYDTPELEDNGCLTSYEAADEVLAACMNELGCVNLGRMSEASGIPAAELIAQLKGKAIFQDPENYDFHQAEEEGWILSSQYLSGNICEKLDIAEQMNKKYEGLFEQNISALKEVLPARVKFSEKCGCKNHS